MKLRLVASLRVTATFGLACAVGVACGDNINGSEVGAGAAGGAQATGGTKPGIDLSGGADGLGLGGDGSGAGLGMAGASCGATKLVAEPPIVNVLLVVDKSGSMDNTPAGFDSDKWSALRGALAETFDQTQDKISFGLDLYPYSGTSGEPLPAEDDCGMPAGSDVIVAVQAGPKAAPKILAALDANPPGGGYPDGRGP